MQLSAMVIFSAAFLLMPLMVLGGSIPSNTAAALHESPNLPAGYVEVPMTFSGYVGPHFIEMYGTINEVITRVVKENPGFDPKSLLNQTSKVIARDAKLDARYSPDQLFCCPVPGQPFADAALERIEANVRYLQSLRSSTCNVGHLPRGGACARVACLYDSGIWLCNDNDHDIQIPCPVVGDMAIAIAGPCQRTVHIGWAWNLNTCGQIFDHPDGFNVYISGTANDGRGFC